MRWRQESRTTGLTVKALFISTSINGWEPFMWTEFVYECEAILSTLILICVTERRWMATMIIIARTNRFRAGNMGSVKDHAIPNALVNQIPEKRQKLCRTV